MIQSANGDRPSSQRDRPKGNYTSERLKLLRPETYRKVVQLLAEPRQHISIREICRRCHVTDDTVKAIQRREAIPIAARKQALMEQAARIAKLAYDRVEDQIDTAASTLSLPLRARSAALCHARHISSACFLSLVFVERKTRLFV